MSKVHKLLAACSGISHMCVLMYPLRRGACARIPFSAGIHTPRASSVLSQMTRTSLWIASWWASPFGFWARAIWPLHGSLKKLSFFESTGPGGDSSVFRRKWHNQRKMNLSRIWVKSHLVWSGESFSPHAMWHPLHLTCGPPCHTDNCGLLLMRRKALHWIWQVLRMVICHLLLACWSVCWK